MASNPAWTDFYQRVELAAAADSGLLGELLPGGHWEGREYRCASVQGGQGSSFGFNKDTGVWCDFATGEKGGQGYVSLYARVHGVANGEAARQLAARYGVVAPNVSLNGAGLRSVQAKAAPKLKAVKNAGWRPVAPFAEELRPEHAEGVQLPAYSQDVGEPVAGWLYLDDLGRPWNYKIRFEKADGKKEYRPLSLCENELGQRVWRWKALPEPHILWNVEKLVRRPDAPVVVVEGEKTADAAERLLGPAGYVVVTWGGGAGNEHHSQWKPLLQRRTAVFLWPDFDDKGQTAMLRIAEMFPDTADVRMVKPDPTWLEKTDLADLEAEGWDGERTLSWLTQHSAPAVLPVTADSERPKCELLTKDHGVLQGNVWSAVKALNRKADGPFYFFGENGLAGELKSVRPNALGDRSLTTPDVGSLRAQITRDIYFSSFNSNGPYPVLPEADLLTSLLCVPCDDLPPLYRFVRTPVFDKEKRLISTPGYDRPSGIYYAPSPTIRGLQIIERPTDEDFQQAMAVVEDVLADFKFAQGAKANAFALMLLPLVRELIDGPTPMHRIEAPSFGTGKSLFLTVALLPTLGLEHLMFLPETKDDEEWRKILVGALRDGWPAILIDNARYLNSAALASLLTATVKWGGRLMHKQDVPSYKIQAVLACTVNNPVWTIEIHRRMLPIRLDARVESPFERTGSTPGKPWQHPALVRYVMERRREILSALLTLAQYGLDRGQPFSRTKGSYESWAQVMGSILEALGFEDFLTSQIKDDATVGTDGLADLMEQLSDHVGKFDLDVAYLKACDLETLTLNGRDDHARKTSLGKLLVSCRDQIRGGKVLRFLGKESGKKQFRLDNPTDE